MGVTVKTCFKTFPQGGIHPSDNKATCSMVVVPSAIPLQAIFPLSQHIGVPAKPVVVPGDKVKVGQLIAEAGGFVSANIHSSVSGTVKKIDDVLDVTGYKKLAIYIDVQGDEWLADIDRSSNLNTDMTLSADKITEKIKAAGLVGLGGAAFPTHVKLSVGKIPPEFLLINGAECEPYLTSDHRTMIECAPQVIVGVKLLMKCMNIKKAIIGVEANKQDAIDLLGQCAENEPGIEVVGLKMMYPQGGERQLVKALIGREISPPPRGLPIDVGAVVINISTAAAVYDAVQKNKPLVERIVTVAGKSVRSPGNFRVRFGTSIRQLVDAAGGLPENATKVTAGGPMMGRAFTDLDTPVTKGVSGIVIYTGQDGFRGPLTNCIRCGKCVSVCPLGLEPYLVAALSERSNFERAEEEKITNCCDCGCCAYICPANRPLVDYIKMGKAKVFENMKKRTAAGKA
jgi:Na+-translocating ferredoxin:NAD+ oxidoreductase subunit C